MTILLYYVITRIGENVFTKYNMLENVMTRITRLRYNMNTGKRVYKNTKLREIVMQRMLDNLITRIRENMFKTL